MDIKFDASGWDALINDLNADKEDITDAAKTNIREAGLSAKRNIKVRMPVDTGAARASWGAEGAAGIWRFEDDGLTNVQGSNLQYIGRLNEGWSRQAPAGFIDAEHEKAVSKFIKDMGRDLERILE